MMDRGTNSIKTPACRKCGARTRLFGIEPGDAGQELLSFECAICQHIGTMVRDLDAPHFSESH